MAGGKKVTTAGRGEEMIDEFRIGFGEVDANQDTSEADKRGIEEA